jgi:hypothetical protein
MIRFKKAIFSTVALAGLGIGISPAYAGTAITDYVYGVFGNAPGMNGGDYLVINLNTNGPCGSGFYLISRAQSNYKDVAAAAFVAFATGKKMFVNVTGCNANTPTLNIISHGAVTNAP